MRPKLCTINIPTTNSEASIKFYSYLCDYEFARSLSERDSHFAPISRDGALLTLTQRFGKDEAVVCYFGVSDLDKAIEELKKRGGKLIAGPFDMSVPRKMANELRRESGGKFAPALGKGALLKDPDGNGVGLLCLERWAHEDYRVGDYYTPVTKKQLVNHRRAIARGKRFLTMRKKVKMRKK